MGRVASGKIASRAVWNQRIRKRNYENLNMMSKKGGRYNNEEEVRGEVVSRADANQSIKVKI